MLTTSGIILLWHGDWASDQVITFRYSALPAQDPMQVSGACLFFCHKTQPWQGHPHQKHHIPLQTLQTDWISTPDSLFCQKLISTSTKSPPCCWASYCPLHGATLALIDIALGHESPLIPTRRMCLRRTAQPMMQLDAYAVHFEHGYAPYIVRS